jgi:ABC-2 type transport system permease protein
VLGLAAFVLRLPIDPLRVDYPLVIGASLLAFAAVTAGAMAFSVALLAARDSYGYGEIFAASLYLVSGAIFPISVLPAWLGTLASLSPLVYWLELVRRGLLGGDAVRMFPALSDGEVLLRLVVATLALVVLAHLFFTWADHRARAKDLIDRVENW